MYLSEPGRDVPFVFTEKMSACINGPRNADQIVARAQPDFGGDFPQRLRPQEQGNQAGGAAAK